MHQFINALLKSIVIAFNIIYLHYVMRIVLEPAIIIQLILLAAERMIHTRTPNIFWIVDDTEYTC